MKSVKDSVDKLWFASWEEVYINHSDNEYLSSDSIPTLVELESNIDLIRTEYKNAERTAYETYFQADLQSPKKSWSTLPLLVFGIKRRNIRNFPKLHQLIKDNPDIVGAFFSRATDNSKIHPHSGITNAIYRCHIGIELPDPSYDYGIEVGGKVAKWSLNKFIAFNDCNYHRSWNHSPHERTVLIVDILKPEFSTLRYYIFSRIAWSYIVLKIQEKTQSRLLYRYIKSTSLKPTVNFFGLILTPIVYLSAKLNQVFVD